MKDIDTPNFFLRLLPELYIKESDIIHTSDGFFVVYKSLSNILLGKEIVDFPGSSGERLECSKFFDDWFLYAVPNEADYTYSLLKLREQEHDAEGGALTDGDTPGVTVSFIAFDCGILIDCLTNPTDENRRKLNIEINRVVAYKRQRHHKALKRYFSNPESKAPYLIASLYVRYIASLAVNGYLEVPDRYQEIVQHICHKRSAKLVRLPNYIESLNEKAGELICDHKKIFIKNKNDPNENECMAILATHTGNVSVYSFAAEVEYHARFLSPLLKLRIPFLGRSIYDSAIRADMTIGDTEFEGPAPFYRADSKIVKRQIYLHKGYELHKGGNCMPIGNTSH